VEGSSPDETIVTDHGVMIIGADNLPSSMAAAASTMYARNISSLLAYMVSDGQLTVDLTDELVAGVVISHGGEVVHPTLAAPPDHEPPAEGAGQSPSPSPTEPTSPRTADGPGH